MTNATETLADRIFSERVLYPVLGIVLAVIVGLTVTRRHSLGPAPALDLPLITNRGALSDQHVRLNELRGKVVILDFWATWCGPCRVMTPVLMRLSERFKNRGLVVVGVNVDDAGPAVVPDFQRSYGIGYGLVYDVQRAASMNYHIEGLPTLIVVDRQGEVQFRHAGVSSEAELATLIEDLL
jgi:cytochrome c biogenesis protein CcmG, thiol:disulfide interchange protein DsbE